MDLFSERDHLTKDEIEKYLTKLPKKATELREQLEDAGFHLRIDIESESAFEGGYYIRGYFCKQDDQPCVTLCSHNLYSMEELHDVFIHELSHAVDHFTLGYDLHDPEDLAKSELRAAFNGDCRRCWSLFRKSCAKNAALQSMQVMHPKKKAEQFVKMALESNNWKAALAASVKSPFLYGKNKLLSSKPFMIRPPSSQDIISDISFF